MSTIGGPGGIGGPKGPKGPEGPEGPESADGADEVAPEAGADAVGQTVVDQLAAEIQAGRLTPKEAVDQLVDLTAGPDIGPAERAELRELLADLVANDPYLGALIGRI